ncbi:MAG: hypothetical protein WDM96_11570 [Lacunisphaera sp.]
MKWARLHATGLGLLLAVPALAGSRESAYRAKELIGPGVWSRVVHLENEPVKHGSYPSEFYGLIVEFADVLWFYTEYDGTQNLSRRRGQVAADKANLGELLRAVDPALRQYTIKPDLSEPIGENVIPPNGCFLACLVRWRELRQAEHSPKHARLIACYPPETKAGHMLLEYRRGLRRYIFDPDRPKQLIRLPWFSTDEPLAVAVRVLGERWPELPVRASALDLKPPRHRAALDRLIATDARPAQPRT